MKINGKQIVKLKSEDVQIKIVAGGLLIFLIVILVPLFWIAHYNVMSADDYAFSRNSFSIWGETHSVWKVLYSQVNYAHDFYYSWQGTYFIIWLISSLLGVFCQNAYYVGTYLSLGGLVVCEFFAFVLVLRKVLGADSGCAVIITASCISMQILMTTVPVEAYYWFTGAVMYTFTYALTILLSACLVLFYHSKLSMLQSVLMNLLLGILSFAIGGSNYVTALCTFLIYLFSCAYFFVRRHRYRFAVLGHYGVFLAAFLLNVVAPGNQVRQNSSGIEHLTAIQSIFLSCKAAAEYLAIFTISPVIILGILLIPVILRITGIRGYKYPFPVFVSIISFGLFAAQFTPTMYAFGTTGPGRVENLYRFSMYILLYGNEIYWIGWARRRRDDLVKAQQGMERSVQRDIAGTCWILPAWVVGGVILLFSLYTWRGSDLTSLSAWNSLRGGEAERYHMEYQERCLLLEDDTKKEVVLPSYSVYPYLLYFDDIVENPSNWKNKDIARWYRKDSVILQK